MSSEPLSVAEQQFLDAGRAVESKSTALKKELRLVDLVGIQILNVVGLWWVGTAGKLGAPHVMYWIAAALLFYVPSGIVVAHLVQEMPLEGGLYQWAKLRFSPALGFLVAANLWLFNLLVLSKAGVVVADNASYAFGSQATWIAHSSPAIVAISIVTIGVLMLLAWRGLSLGKWVNNFGSLGIVLLFVGMIAVAVPRWLHSGGYDGPVTAPLVFTLPALSLLNLNLLGKMGFGACGGFDGVGIFAGECRAKDVGRSMRRSVWIAAPVISAMLIAGTASVLAFSSPADIDLVSPMTQVFDKRAPALASGAALLLVLALLAGNALAFSSMVRLPMVAGWDHLMPGWFCRLDPRYGTPLGSVLFAGAVAVVIAVLANTGTGNQEAFQLLDNCGGILYGLSYLVMFAIPLLAAGETPPWSVRLAAVSGFFMTLLYVVLSVFPIISLENPGIFTAKVATTVIVLECGGAAYYLWAIRRTGARCNDSGAR